MLITFLTTVQSGPCCLDAYNNNLDTKHYIMNRQHQQIQSAILWQVEFDQGEDHKPVNKSGVAKKIN